MMAFSIGKKLKVKALLTSPIIFKYSDREGWI